MTTNPAAKILIIDDEESILESLKDILGDEGYDIFTAENAEEARREYLAIQPDLVLLDIWMPDTDGISLLREWQSECQLYGPVVMMSGHGTIETAVEATKLGAYDFLEKPLSTAKLMLTIERALQAHNLQKQNEALKAQINPPIEIIGKSRQTQALRKQALGFAKQDLTLLISGNAGVGKQQLARYIHQHSARADAPFVAANLAAMDSQDILATLIGNEKRAGLIAQAEGGILYFDELSMLNEDGQDMLLNLIEHQEYYRGDGSGKHNVNIRVIGATRLPSGLLKEHLDDRLFDRLMIATLTISPLKEHSEDIPELLDFFSQYFADYEQMTYRHFSLAAQNALRNHHWPGNIHEVKNLVQRLLIASDDPEISAEEAKEALTPSTTQLQQNSLWSQIIPKDLSLREAREVFEHQYLLEQFRHCNGNVAKLAGRVGMDRTNLYRKLRSLGIDPTEKPKG
ncbi:MAG: nitrogen assimilation regulator [Cardiobacteriales bacterium]|nr:MAG: nitrogen assimilation regulator [Cardiobacteriales bacterium]